MAFVLGFGLKQYNLFDNQTIDKIYFYILCAGIIMMILSGLTNDVETNKYLWITAIFFSYLFIAFLFDDFIISIKLNRFYITAIGAIICLIILYFWHKLNGLV